LIIIYYFLTRPFFFSISILILFKNLSIFIILQGEFKIRRRCEMKRLSFIEPGSLFFERTLTDFVFLSL